MYRVLIVEDDPGIADAVRQCVQSWGLEAQIIGDFRNVLSEFSSFSPQLVILDISLPFFDGYHWCREIRKCSRVPILFLSSASDNMNIIMAMNMGADDFIAKPFDLSVLAAKVQALLRRAYDFAVPAPMPEHRGAVLDVASGVLLYRGERIGLTKNECRILSRLMESRGKTVSRESLMQALWETDQFVDENTLTVNVNRLRRKLDAAGLTHFIATRFGVGYIVEENPAQKEPAQKDPAQEDPKRPL